MRFFVPIAALLVAGGCSQPSSPAADLRLVIGSPRVVTMTSGLETREPIALMDLTDASVILYIASDHHADNNGVRATERLSITLPIGGTDRYPLDGVTAGMFYRNDALGVDLMSFRGYAWWQDEPDGWQVEIDALSLTTPPVEVRATFSGLFVDHAMTGAPLNP